MYATDDTIILGKIYFSIYVSLLKHSDLSSFFFDKRVFDSMVRRYLFSFTCVTK